MPFSALTPPKASDTPSTDSRTSPLGRPRSTRLGRAHGGSRRIVSGVGDLQVRGNLAGAAVLIAHLCLDVHALAAVEQSGDERCVFLADQAPADLARTGELIVVGVELLVDRKST